MASVWGDTATPRRGNPNSGFGNPNAGYGTTPPYGGTGAIPRGSGPGGKGADPNANPFPSGDPTGGGTTTIPTQPGIPEVPHGSPPLNHFDWLNAGYDRTKLNDPTHSSLKYTIGRLLSQFDPHQGITGGVLSALNGLGYGTFSGSGDRLSMGAPTATGQSAGFTGGFSGNDWIEGFNSPNPRWSYDPFIPDPQTAAAGSSADPFAALSASLAAGGGSQPAAQTDLSWLGPLLQSVVTGLQRPPTEPTTAELPVPSAQPVYSRPSPTFYGGYVDPGYGGSSANATSLLSMALPKLLTNPNAANDPLVQQILRLVQGGHA